MAADNACLSNGWSAISSAATNSQLAGLLAGFVFAGVTILFSRPGSSSTRTLILFAPTFVVLGFDSYLFSMLTGGGADPLCGRLWSQSMPASGMLAVGAAGVVSGIAWLLADHAGFGEAAAQDDRTTHNRDVINLHRISRFMIYGVSVAVMLLLAVNTLDYLELVLGNVNPSLVWLILSSPVAVLICTLVLGWTRRRRSVAMVERSLLSTGATTTALSWAAFGTLTYAVVGPVFAGALTVSEKWSERTSGVIIGISVLIGLVAPALLVTTLALAAPPVVRKSGHVPVVPSFDPPMAQAAVVDAADKSATALPLPVDEHEDQKSGDEREEEDDLSAEGRARNSNSSAHEEGCGSAQ